MRIKLKNDWCEKKKGTIFSADAKTFNALIELGIGEKAPDKPKKDKMQRKVRKK